ncbi:bifunctional protein-serine/threonine kinase/phosphatase [Paucibacter soli]|uniref:bifunctional protein-serine/threonine kinase/phosphatase n=1 Tax=Paucibacter soli TaxID=3133433 RepID=UPI0030B5361B
MSFDIAIGLASARGPRADMEDCAAVQRDAARGWIAAVADGVSAGGGGRMAARTTVTSLVQDFFAAPPDWDVSVALDRLIGAQNTWLFGHNRRQRQAAHAEPAALTTLSVLALHGDRYTLAHVGDTRIYLLRGDACLPLTQDHKTEDGGGSHFARLTRAIGLHETLQIDYASGALHAGDRLLLCTDGVHGALSTKVLSQLLRDGDEPQACAEALVQAALAAGSHDNATALLLQVRGLGTDGSSLLDTDQGLPVPPLLAPGAQLDGLTVQALVADNGVHRVYRVQRRANGQLLALKTLCEGRAGDPQERAMLAHEGWLGQRLAGAGLVRVQPQAGAASCFYLLFDWQEGQTLEQLMQGAERPALLPFLQAASALSTALARLHRAGVVHRDIKPANLQLGADGQWRILDLGVALSGREPEALRDLHAGTPSYINPEQWADPPAPPDAGSDLYALGVTLYQWLTGHLPYGEIEPYQMARFRRDPRAPSRTRPEVPIWLDHVLLKAVAREAALRFETAEELLLALERGAARPLPAPGSTPLARRNPLALWQIALGLSLLFNALLIYWLLFLPR